MAAGVVSEVIGQLGSILADELHRRAMIVIDADDDVRMLSSAFKAIEAVLKDAEQQQLTSEAVKVWIQNLKDVAYEMDDVLDEWNTAILLHEEEEGHGNEHSWLEMQLLRIFSCLFKVCPFFIPFSWNSFDEIGVRYDVGSKIKVLNQRLDVIDKEKNTYNFTTYNDCNNSAHRDLGVGRKLTSSVLYTEVKGREVEKAELVKMLVSDREDSESCGLQVISIVGMGGLGKTTLAKLVYREVRMKGNHFDKCIWVCVTDTFDEVRVAKSILGALWDSRVDVEGDFADVLEKIHNCVRKLKLFLVLDDAWEQDVSRWEELMGVLRFAKAGSRILVTTRKETVANTLGCTRSQMIRLLPLSQDACWLVFSGHAFLGWDSKEIELVKDIGEKIVRQKCNGLPLAAKVLGAALRSVTSRRQWEGVLNSPVWELKISREVDLFAPLWLSYHELPPQLKQCLSYCAIFPKDFIVEKDKLIRLWMAQGYLGAPSSKEGDLELVGEIYFENLARRSFFQEIETNDSLLGSGVTCKMHDLVHDFAQFISSNECYSMEADVLEQHNMEFLRGKVRHLGVALPRREFPTSFNDWKSLRSLLFLGYLQYPDPVVSRLPDLLDQSKCLRSLDVSNCDLDELHPGICELMHLRMLDVSSNRSLRRLPEGICNLHNLQTLALNYCHNLMALPNRMEKLVKLRHLLNLNAPAAIPKEIGRFHGLRTLLELNLDSSSTTDSASLSDLQNLNLLQGHLKINRLGLSLDHVSEAKQAELEKKKGLTVLSLHFSWDKDNHPEWRTTGDEKLVEALKLPECVQHLTIVRYHGTKLSPSWLLSLIHLRKFTLKFCFNCEQLPPLGRLPSLEQLELGSLDVEKVGREFLGFPEDDNVSSSSSVAFPRLTRLRFFNMQYWTEWDGWELDIQIMPCLHTLEVGRCYSLKKLPDQLLQKTTLEELKINWCYYPLSEIYQSGHPHSSSAHKGEEWERVAHIPKLTIDKFTRYNDGTSGVDGQDEWEDELEELLKPEDAGYDSY
ncbi:unnamed protein product [Linum trigynum]|uniref:Uncharacterized protein n=1 Tax=Linum trigynum TaxID=586398 RepID=A0AAV2D3C7_9ROSI